MFADLRRLLLAALVPLAFSPGAHAALNAVDFTVSWSAGVDAGTQSVGSFAYDDAIVPLGGGIIAGADLFSDFDFSFRGVQYDAGALQLVYLNFDAAGALRLFFFGNHCDAVLQFCGVSPYDGDTAKWWVFKSQLSHRAAGWAPSTLDGAWEISLGTVDASPWASPIPEPQTNALLLGGLAAVALLARRKAA